MGFVWLDVAFEFRRWPLLLNPKPSHAIYYTDWLFINRSSKLAICCLELFCIIDTCICYKHVTSFLMGGGGKHIRYFHDKQKKFVKKWLILSLLLSNDVSLPFPFWPWTMDQLFYVLSFATFIDWFLYWMLYTINWFFLNPACFKL